MYESVTFALMIGMDGMHVIEPILKRHVRRRHCHSKAQDRGEVTMVYY